MSVTINIDARPHEVEDVYLGDDGPWVFTTPKSANVMSALRKLGAGNGALEVNMNTLGLLNAQWGWLEEGLGSEVWEHIEARLADNDDPLDYPHLQQLFDVLFEQVSNRPPSSAGGSSESPPAKKAAAKQMRKA